MSTISTRLPIYSGLIETARANNRQGFPVGAAYLRQASDLMRTEILPAADRLYAVEAQRLIGDYRSGVGSGTFSVVALTGLLALAALIGCQLYVTWRTHRVLNVHMLVGTIVLLAVIVWTLAAFSQEQDSLSTAQRKGSDPVGSPLSNSNPDPACREERRLEALEARIDADLALGRHRALVAELERLVAAEPLRERFRAQLMLALYRCGRQADALGVYRDVRLTLVESVGIEPGPELRRLERAVLTQDPELEAP